ncbi:phage tail tube protein [Burkholderia vietnamiensis]|uniref:phage tail tube protein n=1 Tax=Burkholderia vietnamiensis TaxID=60552 RepID=UPI000754E035|nr:phage tail tube protein [Burkholderia vietnamiensis]KVR97203.1 phage tail protein [Burkholderia vietnamiensis]
MSSTAKTAQGTTIAINTGTDATPVWTDIKNVSDISGFDGKAAEIDTTDLSSVAKERVLGLQDWGTVTLAAFINLSEASHAALLAAKKAGTKKSFKVTLSDASTIAFDAFVATFPIAAKVDSVYSGNIALTVTGDLTVTVGP